MPVDIVMWVVVGLIVGWLVGSTMKGSGYGLVGDIAIAVGASTFVALARLLTRRRTPA